MDLLRDIVKKYWGYDDFLPLQREAMDCVMRGRDSMVVLPTGGGKSLCFQAPAMAMEGMAVVISPLLSLMKDQVDALRTNGVPAAKIDSTMTGGERKAVHRAIQERRLKLIYVSPERVVQPNFIAYLQEIGVSFLVIDEAHCISQWGHDFRPEYRELCCLREAFPDKAIHAYTATATEHVREDIVTQLGLRDAERLTGSFDRPNLHYRLQRRGEAYRQIRDMLAEHAGESGIIYCIRRADVDTLCERLTGDGYKALPYHAGMTDEVRKRNQDAFSKEEVDIVVATVAFGMGIDKSNVRYVIHASMPKSIEHYHQETGRAGRDGLASDCLLLYSYADFKLWQAIIEKNESEGADVALSKLRDMQRYCDQLACRHQALVSYFGQKLSAESCGACDVCERQVEVVDDCAELARSILGGVAALGDIAGPAYATLVLSGSREARVLSKGHDRLACYGALAAYDGRMVRDWIEQLVQQGYLEKCGEYNILTLTESGRAALDGGGTPVLAKPVEASRKSAARAAGLPGVRGSDAALSVVEKELFEALRIVRRSLAEEREVPPFVICSDATLRDMARRKPRSNEAMLEVYGMGERKTDAFGSAFVEAISGFCDQAEIEEEIRGQSSDWKPSIANRRSPKGETTQQRAAALFAQGQSVEEVAEQLVRKPSTVYGYLVKYVQDSHVTDPSPWVAPDVVRRVYEAITASDEGGTRPVYERLNGEVGHSEIRICMACMINAAR